MLIATFFDLIFRLNVNLQTYIRVRPFTWLAALPKRRLKRAIHRVLHAGAVQLAPWCGVMAVATNLPAAPNFGT